MKFELLERARLIIETSATFQEYDEGFEYMTLKKIRKEGRGKRPSPLLGLGGHYQ